MHSDAVAAVERLRAAGDQPVIVPQVLYEYWVVATRPANLNGLGLSPEAARRAVDEFMLTLLLLRDERGIFDHWISLVTDSSVAGKVAHDARLVAAMLRHGITHLLTFNAVDFSRFHGIAVLQPTLAR